MFISLFYTVYAIKPVLQIKRKVTEGDYVLDF